MTFVVLLSKCHPWCLIVWHRLISSCPLLRLPFPLPLGGGGDTSSPPKKKKMSRGMFVHQDLFGLPLWDAPWRVSRRTLGSFPLSPPRVVVVREKKKRERGTTHENCKCYAASSSARVEPDATFSRCSVVVKAYS